MGAAEVVAIAGELVRRASPSSASNQVVADFVAERLRQAGCRVERIEYRDAAGVGKVNVVAKLGRGAGGLTFFAHTDTVPADDWAAGAPFTPEVRQGRLYGRGACDMKGPIAAMLQAAARAARGRPLRRPLALAFTFAEETGCDGALALVDARAALGDLSGAQCLVGEPTGLRPMTGHKGYWIAQLSLSGVPAHSSRPHLGADASRALALLLAGLHELRQRLAAGPHAAGFDPPHTTLNTGLLSAGQARNVVPDRAEVTVELRPVPGADAAALRAALEDCLRRATAAVPGTSGTLRWVEAMPAFGQPPGAPLVDWLAARTGAAPGVVPFYTEAELYRAGLGTPACVCGPGSIDQAHRVDESIAFEELAAGEELYAEAIAAFCG